MESEYNDTPHEPEELEVQIAQLKKEVSVVVEGCAILNFFL